MAAKSKIRCIRGGQAKWNEEDRLALAALLVKAGYAVHIGRELMPPDESHKKEHMEYVVEYWETDAMKRDIKRDRSGKFE